MVKSIRLVGGAGTGKTTRLEQLIETIMERVGDLRKIGFASFSRAAKSEIVSRVCNRYGFDEKTLKQECWFRTLHSIAFNQVGASGEEILDCGSSTGTKWLRENLDVELSSYIDETGTSQYLADSDEARSLNIWSMARNTLTPVILLCRAQVP